MTDRDEEYLAERYGRTASAARRRAALAGLGVLGVVGLGVVVWIGLLFARQPVRWDDVGYKVESPTSVTVVFDVTMAPGTTATCRVEALAQSYAQVGVLDVVVGPSEHRTTRYTETIPTAQEAVTAVVDTCTLD